MKAKQARTAFGIEFEDKEFFVFEKGLALAQMRDRQAYSNKQFAQKAIMRYCAMLIELDKKGESET